MKIIYIEEDKEEEKLMKQPLCLGDLLDSRAVLGLVERNLLMAPWVVIMYANEATMEAFRES